MYLQHIEYTYLVVYNCILYIVQCTRRTVFSTSRVLQVMYIVYNYSSTPAVHNTHPYSALYVQCSVYTQYTTYFIHLVFHTIVSLTSKYHLFRILSHTRFSYCGRYTHSLSLTPWNLWLSIPAIKNNWNSQ